MAVEHVLHCDDGNFEGWTSRYWDDPSVIEQIPAAAHNGAAGNHIVVNEHGKVAYASLQNWASSMSIGEMRAVGFWWKLVVPAGAGLPGTGIIALSIDAAPAVLLSLNEDNEVKVAFTRVGGGELSDWCTVFTGSEWHHIRLVAICHDTAGGIQVYDGNTLLIDEASYDTTLYNGTLDWLHAGAIGETFTGLDTYQDEFRIATTLADARAGGVGARKLVGVGR